MHLTPAILESAYNYLRATPPFNKWKLPESDAVEFHVNDSKITMGSFVLGYYQRDAKETIIPRIFVSQRFCAGTGPLIDTMAHEMVHMYVDVADAKRSRRHAEHGPKFKRLAAQVCRAHGFDPKTF